VREKNAAADPPVAEIASRQHGVVSTRQLLDAGLIQNEIATRIRNGHLYRAHQGVYFVGFPGHSLESRWMAAVLACGGHCGELAFLSHRSAAALWEMLPPDRGMIDVAIVGEVGRAWRAGLRIHRPRTLEVGMTTHRAGIPVTNSQRTISDLRRAKPSRGGATPEQLRRAMRQAAMLGLPVGPATRADRTRSDLEKLFLRLCRAHGISAPEVNVDVGGLEVDFLWRSHRAVVETDGYRYHRGRIAFKNDRDRDLRLVELGFRVLRFSDAQLEDEPTRVASGVHRLLAASFYPHEGESRRAGAERWRAGTGG
jgi:very-short-patch-repair endonuclease